MKDVAHHRKHLQKKTLQSLKRENNGRETEINNKVPILEMGKRTSDKLNSKNFL